jgi:hypothetical protein
MHQDAPHLSTLLGSDAQPSSSAVCLARLGPAQAGTDVDRGPIRFAGGDLVEALSKYSW